MTITPAAIAAAIGLLGASITDVRTGKIPNAIAFPMMVLGLIIHPSLGDDWKIGVFGLLAATAIHFPLWMFGVQKGGDAKLFMGVGALLGWVTLLEATLWSAVLYLPIGLGVLVATGKLGNLKAVAKYQMAKAQGLETGEAPEPTKLRTAPIIAVAAVLAFATEWLNLI